MTTDVLHLGSALIPGAAPVMTAPGVVPAVARATRRLPGPALAVGRPPRAETVVFMTVAPLLALPILLATMVALWAVTVTVVLTGTFTWVLLARRVVIGRGWIAERRLLRNRITFATQLRVAELVHTEHGGILRLHRHVGRPHRLRLVEIDAPSIRRALTELLAASPAVDHRVALALAISTAGISNIPLRTAI